MTADSRKKIHTPASQSGAQPDPDQIPEIAVRILQAAVQLFAQKGYAGTSVREIVQEAEVTNPMLYYYFDSKEGLFCFLTQRLHEEFARKLKAAIADGTSLHDKLVRVVDVHLEGLRDRPIVLRFVYSMLFGARGSAPEHELYRAHDEIVDAIIELFERETRAGNFTPAEGSDLRWSAYQLLGLVNSHSMRVIKELELLPDSEQDVWLDQQAGPDTAERLVRFFLNGAGDVTS